MRAARDARARGGVGVGGGTLSARDRARSREIARPRRSDAADLAHFLDAELVEVYDPELLIEHVDVLDDHIELRARDGTEEL